MTPMTHTLRKIVLFALLAVTPVFASGCLLMGPGDGAPCRHQPVLVVTPTPTATTCFEITARDAEPDCGRWQQVTINNDCADPLLIDEPAFTVEPGLHWQTLDLTDYVDADNHTTFTGQVGTETFQVDVDWP